MLRHELLTRDQFIRLARAGLVYATENEPTVNGMMLILTGGEAIHLDTATVRHRQTDRRQQ